MVCLIFVCILIVIIELFPYEYNFPEELSGEVVLVEGKVISKEIKNKNGQTSYNILLKPISHILTRERKITN